MLVGSFLKSEDLIRRDISLLLTHSSRFNDPMITNSILSGLRFDSQIKPNNSTSSIYPYTIRKNEPYRSKELSRNPSARAAKVRKRVSVLGRSLHALSFRQPHHGCRYALIPLHHDQEHNPVWERPYPNPRPTRPHGAFGALFCPLDMTPVLVKTGEGRWLLLRVHTRHKERKRMARWFNMDEDTKNRASQSIIAAFRATQLA